VNTWIRTSGELDSVIDFAAATGDPADPLRPAYDSGDHLHPDDAGMAALAAAVPLRLFRQPQARRAHHQRSVASTVVVSPGSSGAPVSSVSRPSRYRTVLGCTCSAAAVWSTR